MLDLKLDDGETTELRSIIRTRLIQGGCVSEPLYRKIFGEERSIKISEANDPKFGFVSADKLLKQK